MKILIQVFPVIGMLSIFILVCHTLSLTEFSFENHVINFLLSCFVSSGYLSVGVFFLFSGYGLIYSFINNEIYLDGFLYKRLPKVIISFGITNLIYIAIKGFMGSNFSYEEIIFSFINSSIMPNAWYMITIILFYIVFYISFRSFKINRSILFISFLIILYIVGCYLLKIGAWWYVSSLPFLIGIVWGANEEKIFKTCKGKYSHIIAASLLIFVFAHKLQAVAIKLFNINIDEIGIIGMIIASSSFSVFFMLLIMKIKFGNKILIWYGKISLELYLIHGLIINIISKFMIINKAYFLILVFLISTIAAYILNKLYSKLICKFAVNEHIRNNLKVGI